MKPVRLGFIGLGHITVNAHLPALAEMAEKGEVVLQAFCDTSEDVAADQAKAFGAKAVYSDHRAMFDSEELDGVYLCIPPTLHTDAENLAADKGVALFVEKPQTLDMAQAAGYNRIISDAGIMSQIGFVSRYFAASPQMRDLLADRTPRHASVQLWYSGKHIRYWTSRYELCGGSFVENTIHMVDLLRYFLGDIESVSAFYHFRKPGEGPEPINMPHVYNANYRFASGVVANATTSRVLTNGGAPRREVTVISDDSLMGWSSKGVEENGETVFQAPEGDSGFASQAKAFVKAIATGDASLLRSPYSDGMNSLSAVLAANTSAERNGEAINLKAFEEGTIT